MTDRGSVPPLPEAAALLVTAAHRLKDSRNYLAAYIAVERAMALVEQAGMPHHVVPLSTRGAILWNMQEWGRAAADLEASVAQVPDHPNYWSILGLCYASLRRDKDSERAYDKALELLSRTDREISIGEGDLVMDEPHPQAEAGRLAIKWNRANSRLARGDWERGFKDYEARIKHRGEPVYPNLPYQRWQGEDLNGKTLVIHGEQGAGDTMLSSRYIPLIKAKWPDARLIWFVQPRLHDLFWEFRHCVEMWPPGHPWPKADYGILQMSLMGLFGARPDKVEPDPGLMLARAKLSQNSFRLPEPHVPALKVGVAWTGSPDMIENDERSIPLELMMELARNPQVALYSLQVGSPGAEQLQFVNCHDLIRDCSRELGTFGFAATGGLMLNLDLVITVCTSNAHLAGALGVPCWTMLWREPYWVWGRDSDETVWYPGMKLFRQPKAGDWRSVIDKVKAKLDRLAAQKFSSEQNLAAS